MGWHAVRVGDRPQDSKGLVTHGAENRFYPGRNEKPRRVSIQERKRTDFPSLGRLWGHWREAKGAGEMRGWTGAAAIQTGRDTGSLECRVVGRAQIHCNYVCPAHS